MIWETIITIVVVLLVVALLMFSYYLYVKNQIMQRINGEVDSEEGTDKENFEKMNACVDMLYSIVPVVLRPFITRSVITSLVQAAFDKMKSFAEKRAEKEKNNK